MKNVFNKNFTLLIISLIFFVAPNIVLAQGIQPDEPVNLPNPIAPYNTITDVVVNVTNYLLYIIATISVLVLVLGGFTYVTSAGNTEEIEKAKTRITYAIIGLIVAIIAWTIINSIVGIFIE